MRRLHASDEPAVSSASGLAGNKFKRQYRRPYFNMTNPSTEAIVVLK